MWGADRQATLRDKTGGPGAFEPGEEGSLGLQGEGTDL